MKIEQLNVIAKDNGMNLGFESNKKSKYTNCFEITITCDENDADYLTEISHVCIKPTVDTPTVDDCCYLSITESTLPLFLKAMRAISVLILTNYTYENKYFHKCWNLLSEEYKRDIYNFELANAKESEYEYFKIPFEQFNLISGGLCELIPESDDSEFELYLHNLFPYSEDGCNYGNDTETINGCHTPKDITIKFIDEDGTIKEINFGKVK